MFDQIRDTLVDSVREKIVDRGLMQPRLHSLPHSPVLREMAEARSANVSFSS